MKQKEFSAITVVAGWDWRRLNSILIKGEKQRVYLVCEDIDKCAAFYKIPELEPYTKIFGYFRIFQVYRNIFMIIQQNICREYGMEMKKTGLN